MKKYYVPLIFLFTAVVVGCSAPYVEEGVDSATEVLEFEIEDLAPGDISGLLSGDSPVLLVFWTIRCPHCVSAVPLINDFNRKHGEEVEVIGINVGESREMVESFAAERGIRYRVGLDRRGEIARSYNVMGVPTYVLIMPGEEIVYFGHSFEEMLRQSGM